VLSDSWKSVLIDEVENIERDDILTLPNAGDPQEYSPKYDSGPINFVFLSNLKRRKGLLEFIKATEVFLSHNYDAVKITIAGDGPLRPEVEKLENKFEQVDYHGYVSEEEKREILNNGSVFVFPTKAEGLPFAILEAMAGGNAIITTKVGSIPEVLSKEESKLIDRDNEKQLVAAMEEYHNHPKQRLDHARRCRLTIEEEYTWQRVAEHLINEYKNIAL
jgi:glycosyltransferase involved in cell wall biosynthesis